MSARPLGLRRQPPRADHVVLVSIDALRPEFYRDERWPAPTLQQLAWEGAAAKAVRSVFPALTYPAHTTIATGALPARHGIWHNRPFQPDGPSIDWYWNASAIRVPALWDAVRAAGGTTAAVAWPVTVGAPIDWNIPDVWVPGEDTDSLRPARAATRPERLFEEIEREATGLLHPEEFQLGSFARDDRMGDIAAYLFEHYRPTLLMVHLIGANHLQHEQGRATPRLRRAVGAVDRAVGAVLEAVERAGLGARTTLIVTGDHGTSAAHTTVRPNVWLARAGLRAERRDGGAWRATFHGDGGAAFLMLRDPRDGEAVALARRALEGVRAGERRLFRVVERHELDRLGAAPGLPFALAAAPGIVFSEAAAGSPLGRMEGAAHGYHPAEPEMRTGFVGAGAGFRRGITVPHLALENVAPLVAALLDLDFMARDGLLLPGLLDP